jgi:23S rRNA (cytosine1962-C5)-methyltransferase
MTAAVRLRAGHVRPIWAGHPWVFAQAIGDGAQGLTAGEEVRVLDAQGKVLGRGLYSPASALAVRLYTRRDEAIDASLFRRRIETALARRKQLGLPSQATNGFRLLHAEGDGLPAVIVDQFDDVLVVQWGTVGIKQREAQLLDVLQELVATRAIIDRTSPQAARTEGFSLPASPIVRGATELTALCFRERGFAYEIPLSIGQKTGFYFDQRPLRERVEALAHGRRVLDTYTFVGSQALSAARGGAATVLAVDSSAEAIAVADQHAKRLQLDCELEFRRADAESVLDAASSGEKYDLVICDPPKFVRSRKGKEAGLGAMRHLIAKAVRATDRNGLVVISSCSAALGMPELARAAALGGSDAGREVTILERVFQGPDHPVPAAFPEGLYLTSLILALD